MADTKLLPPIPFAPKKTQPFCLVDGDTGLVLAAQRRPAPARDSPALAGRESTLPAAGSKPGAVPG